MTDAYQQLNKFVGQWKTRGLIPENGTTPEVIVEGTDSYEWLPGEYFLKHSADVMMGNDRNQTIEIIGFDKDANHYTMHYFDNKGESGFMKAIFSSGRWSFEGDNLRFRGSFSEDNKVFSGSWEKKEKSGWTHFMTIELRKIS
jgi:hypothetical protein